MQRHNEERIPESIKWVKEWKSTKLDEILSSFIKNNEENIKNMLYDLVYRMYETGKVLQEFLYA